MSAQAAIAQAQAAKADFAKDEDDGVSEGWQHIYFKAYVKAWTEAVAAIKAETPRRPDMLARLEAAGLPQTLAGTWA